MARTAPFRIRYLLRIIWLTLATVSAVRANDPAVSCLLYTSTLPTTPYV